MYRYEIAPVVVALRRSRARRIDGEHTRCDPRSVEPIAKSVDAHGRCDDPQRVDRLVTVQSDPAQSDGATQGQEDSDDLVHCAHPSEKCSGEQCLHRSSIAGDDGIPLPMTSSTHHLFTCAPYAI